MSPQADYVVSNGTGAAVRSDINGQLAAIVSNNSGASAPATTYAYMLWADTSTSLLKLRNGANSAWITVGDLTAANLGLATLASPTFTGTATIPTLTVSTAANIPLGSAASPTLYFTGDSNTGLYSPGADQVALSTGGTGRLFINSSGSVGIGTSSPQTLLHVAAGSGASAYATFSGNNGSPDPFIIGQDTSGLTRLFHTGAQPISFWIAGVERMRLTSTGLGIGTTTVNSLFEARGTSNNQDIIQLSNSAGTSDGDTTNRIRVTANGNSVWANLNIQAYQTIFTQNGTERARIDPSGRWLLGTSSGRTVGAVAASIQIEGVTDTGLSVTNNSNGSAGDSTWLTLARTRGTAVGGTTAVSNNDWLGSLDFAGHNGSSFNVGARIIGQVDGAVSGGGVGDMPGRLVFSTTADGASSPTERMRITNSGNVLIGTTSTTPNPGIVFSPGFNAQITIGHDNTSGSGQYYIPFYYNGGLIGGVTQNGTTAVAYNTTSDYRLKENVTAVTDGIVRLQQLKPCKFNFIAEPDRTVDGFIAHEVQEVIPEAITGVKDAEDEDGNPVYQGIDQSKLVPLLTAALQEAIGEIESLKARVAALESA